MENRASPWLRFCNPVTSQAGAAEPVPGTAAHERLRFSCCRQRPSQFALKEALITPWGRHAKVGVIATSRWYGGLSVQGPVRPVVIVVVLPLAELLVEQVDVIRDAVPVE